MQINWLSHIEEQAIKAQIDSESFLKPHYKKLIDRLHILNGVVLLKIEQTTIINTTFHMIILRYNEELSYFIQEAIYKTKEKHTDLDIDWNSNTLYNVLGRNKLLGCTILTSEKSFNYFETLLLNLDV